MRKVMMLMFLLMLCALVATPAFAQGTETAASGTNWVAITSGFAMAFAGRPGSTWSIARGWFGLRRHGAQSRRPSRDSAGADSRAGLYRVPGPVYRW